MTPAVLADIAARAYQHMTPWSAVQFAATLSQNNHILTETQHAFVLGQIVLDEVEILAVATDPDHHRNGEATRAFVAFRAKAKEKGAKTLLIEVAKNNLPAIGFYERHGFDRVGLRKNYYKRPDTSPMDALIMSAKVA